MVIFEEGIEGSHQKQVKLESWEHPEKLWRMQLPSGFQMLGEEEKKQDFLYEPVPEMVLYDEREQAWITLQLLDKPLKREELGEAGEAIRKLMVQTYPQDKSTPVYCQEEGEFSVVWFAMAMEERKTEHVKAIFSLHNQQCSFVLLTFTYPKEEQEKWRAVLPILFSTIEEGGKEGFVRKKCLKEQEGGKHGEDRRGGLRHFSAAGEKTDDTYP